MELSQLAPELLELIILQSIPEGFASLTLTCKDIHELCRPHLERHNRHRKRFRNFVYSQKSCYGSVRSAYSLIAHIAADPIVARYIRKGDFSGDSLRTERDGLRASHSNARCSEAVARLLADSSYLKEAGLDWEEYRAAIESDLKARHYSQHAAVFLLTLLPNIEILNLPHRWGHRDPTTKLLDSIICRANQVHHSCAVPSLAQITSLNPSTSIPTRLGWYRIEWMYQFWALPRVRFSQTVGCIDSNDSHQNTSSQHAPKEFEKTLEVVHFVNSAITDTGIANFVKHTPRLRKLIYQHAPETCAPRWHWHTWDLCNFVRAIGCEVGSHLEELSISIRPRSTRFSISPGKTSMRAFQRLRKLEVPLELVMGNIAASAGNALDVSASLVSELVPPTVVTLSLVSLEIKCGDDAIEVLFHNFAANRKSCSLALKEVYLVCRNSAGEFQHQFSKARAETKRAGVDLHVLPYRNAALSWQMESE